MRSSKVVAVLMVMICCCKVLGDNSPEEIKRRRVQQVKKHLKRLKKVEGGIKLIGGIEEFEGNVEILHNGTWGAICDDEWDLTEAQIICHQLGYPKETAQATINSHFGPAKRRFWMDNVYCNGTEMEISYCRFSGWGENDCSSNEAAGVICSEAQKSNEIAIQKADLDKDFMVPLPGDIVLRLVNGRVPTEGRVELSTSKGSWHTICGDGWSILEALVVCKSLNLGYASDAMQTDYFGGILSESSLSQVKCVGNESKFSECFHNGRATGFCKDKNIAAVSCTKSMPDLVIDHVDLMRTAYLEDKQMFFLQCAMEENCVASSAYEIQKENNGWHLETRRLLRFTARIFNAGTADFRPAIPKHLWEWHMCHMHYHSMEVFATFDIYNLEGHRVAEGHKASFCLEDNQCLPGIAPKYACANYGDQGISVNCSDIYKYTVDCQWVDITDLDPGNYKIKVAVNPEYKVPEMSYENNAALCDFIYNESFGHVANCMIQRP